MKITVALPTYNNANIVWLAMEGLIRQKNSPEWELLIHECVSRDVVGAEFFRSYWAKLKKAGCKRLLYNYSPTRLALNQKWLSMAKQATGDVFCLQGSDDYPHPERNKMAAQFDVDWYDCRKYFQYHIALEKMIEYDNKQTKAHEPQEWKTGFNMSIKTKFLKAIKSDEKIKSGVDFWLFNNCKIQSRHVDQNTYNGVSTTGLNTISTKRFRYFQKPEHPFYLTDETLESLKIPKLVIDKLKEIKSKAIIERPAYDTTPVHVKFLRSINGRQKGHLGTLPAHSIDFFLIRDAIKLLEPKKEPEKNFEICV